VNGYENIEFWHLDISRHHNTSQFDVVYARFLLTHLTDPATGLGHMQQFLRPGGAIVVEDIDFTGHFCHPDSPAFWRYVDLYTQAVQQRGADPNIGPRLPRLLLDSGLERVAVNIVQPAGIEGEVKLVSPITMENIADSVLAAGLATREEIDQVVDELYDFARSSQTLMSIPRIVQPWGYST
jgi:hypothetical protein